MFQSPKLPLHGLSLTELFSTKPLDPASQLSILNGKLLLKGLSGNVLLFWKKFETLAQDRACLAVCSDRARLPMVLLSCCILPENLPNPVKTQQN